MVFDASRFDEDSGNKKLGLILGGARVPCPAVVINSLARNGRLQQACATTVPNECNLRAANLFSSNLITNANRLLHPCRHLLFG